MVRKMGAVDQPLFSAIAPNVVHVNRYIISTSAKVSIEMGNCTYIYMWCIKCTITFGIKLKFSLNFINTIVPKLWVCVMLLSTFVVFLNRRQQYSGQLDFFSLSCVYSVIYKEGRMGLACQTNIKLTLFCSLPCRL